MEVLSSGVAVAPAASSSVRQGQVDRPATHDSPTVEQAVTNVNKNKV